MAPTPADVQARLKQTVYRYATPRGAHLFSLSSDGSNIPAPYNLEGAVFNVYAAQYANTTRLYRCNANNHQFLPTDIGCEGQHLQAILGYIASEQAGRLHPLYRTTNGSDYLESDNSDEGSNAGYALEGVLGFTPPD